ncbi:unnamed protein product [Owenia fusiformis]|uniref:DNA helicase n=1 Tax=Owenia fusiformis TaxID=6347 RepID=A0A8S4PZA5_OWEFU|nr:unnamed protein product [Owenia fusiformis]
MLQFIWLKRRRLAKLIIIIVVVLMTLMLHSSLFLRDLTSALKGLKPILNNSHDIDSKLKVADRARNVSNITTSTNVTKPERTCSFDRKEAFPYLRGIYTTPPLNINFHKKTFEYDIEVDYDVLVISITSETEYCEAEGLILLRQKDNSSIQDVEKGKTRRSFSIGLSLPLEVQINVVDLSSSSINYSQLHRYVLTFRRRPRGLRGSFHTDSKHKVCLMKQECDRRIFSEEPCGLQTTKYDSWSMMNKRNARLPECLSGNEPGNWLVPCKNCSDADSCYWQQAKWQPDNCIHQTPSNEQIQRVFDGKQLLFLGDSTLRGIMYFLIESVNGSLSGTSKSHDALAYNDINRGRTRMSFIYYPQLEDDPPPISIALRSLVKNSCPVKNDSSTVLLVGRFKSIPNSDFPQLMSTLKQLKLTGIKLIMKTMGSNRCTGDVMLNVVANDELTANAQRYGFEILQTFPIIMARYKDATYGSCALHYHHITKVDPFENVTTEDDGKVSHQDMFISLQATVVETRMKKRDHYTKTVNVCELAPNFIGAVIYDRTWQIYKPKVVEKVKSVSEASSTVENGTNIQKDSGDVKKTAVITTTTVETPKSKIDTSKTVQPREQIITKPPVITPEASPVPVRRPIGSNRMRLDSDSEDIITVSQSSSATSSPWLSKQKGKLTNGNGSPASKFNIQSEERTFQEKYRHLRDLFPAYTETQIKDAIMETVDLDSAIDVLGFGSTNERKRIRTISSPDVQPKKKRAKPLDFEEDDSIDLTQDDDDIKIVLTDEQEVFLQFLVEAFPDLPKQKLQDMLESNQWDTEAAMNAVNLYLERGGTGIKEMMAQNKIRTQVIRSKNSTYDSSDDEVSVVDEKKDKKKKKERRKSGSDVEFDEEDYDSDDSSQGDPVIKQTQKEMVLSFFNDAQLEELMIVPGCSRKKADVLVSLRPFEDFDDLTTKVEENKTITDNILAGCKDFIKIRNQVKSLMQKCESISTSLEDVVNSIMGKMEMDNPLTYQISKQPALLNKRLQLKDYQLIGLNWLLLMHKQHLNGILADEMGLGKTIQAIAFLCHLLETGDEGPHLVIAPSSTLDNWLREFNRWCPAMKILMYYGSQDERRSIRAQIYAQQVDFNVVITTYTTATSSVEDRLLFKSLKCHYGVLDEGHMLKNMTSLRYQNLMKIRVKRRLLLTGTPMQNNLVELMSLLAFVMPDLFYGKTDQLKRIFAMIQGKGDGPQSKFERDRIEHAKRIMKPFVLRRLKQHVLKQLPAKIEHVEVCPMAFEQRELYDDLIQQFRNSLKEDDQRKNLEKQGKSMFMQLRKVANHHLLNRNTYSNDKLKQMAKLMLQEPTHAKASKDLIYEDMEVMSDFELHKLCEHYSSLHPYMLDDTIITDSGKFRYLDEVLPDIKAKGDRVLLFSQFTMMLDIMEVYLQTRGHKYFRLDGGTPVPERQTMIDKFNIDPKVFIFLLSTKAGGLGINLVAANVVIIHDIDFNPYNDKQAEDRCHRLGQLKDVRVIRLISEGTIEPGMLKCAQEKLQLEQDLTSNKISSEGAQSDVAVLLKEAIGDIKK